MREAADIHLERQAGDTPEGFAVAVDLVDYFVRLTDKVSAKRTNLGVELVAGRGLPASLFSYPSHHFNVAGEEFVCRLFR